MTRLPRAHEGSDAGAARSGLRHDSPLPGQLLGEKYRIEERVAEGGMGVVLRATHLELNCPVAIKLIRPEHTGNEEVIGRLLAEARIAAGLRSKHVNHVLDVGRTAHGIPYLVLEYMEGSDLRAHLQQRGRLPITEAVDCVLQTCEALAEAHAFGIVHRDLKPENLFLSEEADGSFVLKVLDFGISKAPPTRRGGRTLTNPFEVVGSPNYMAPEQIRGGQVDARSDVWALGVLLYELCTGRVPYAAETITETFSLILDPNYELSALDAGPGSDELRAVLDRCLCKNPDERYQSVVELAEALSPLGSDALQGKRVAKVAMAARARVAASGTPARPSPHTPLALSTSLQQEVEVEEPTAEPRRFGWLWLGAGAAALALLGLGFGFASRTAMSPAAAARDETPVASRAELVRVAPPEPAAGLAPRTAAPAQIAPAPVQIAPAPVARPGAFSARPVAAPRRASASTTRAVYPTVREVSLPAPPVDVVVASAAEPPPPPPPVPVAEPVSTDDAWDPKTFGGRR
jgi:serine/threonine-protein kinase